MRKFLLILLFFLIFSNFVFAQEKTKPGEVEIEWETKNVSVCPPGILGTGPCQYPGLVQVIQKIQNFILSTAPYVLVILLILGGLMYLLSPIKYEQIKTGHRYLQWAVYGYIFLLLVSLIFTFVSAVFGGPSP